MSFRNIFVFVLVGFLSAASAMPKSDGVKYVTIEVDRFEVQRGIELPSKFKITLVIDIKLQLADKLGIEVISEGQDQRSTGPGLRLTGTITEFKGGQRVLRYIVPVALGKTKIGAHIKVLDRQTGEVLFESDVDGKVMIGPYGGDTMGASNGLAKEVAKKIKKRFF